MLDVIVKPDGKRTGNSHLLLEMLLLSTIKSSIMMPLITKECYRNSKTNTMEFKNSTLKVGSNLLVVFHRDPFGELVIISTRIRTLRIMMLLETEL